jgi:hypothetical protein
MRFVKHGMYGTSEYWSWALMKKRCYNAKWEGFARYGGRGIKVCERWLNSFANFYSDLGPKPDPRYTLHRFDNDADYEPSNCCWATPTEQANNRINNRLVDYRGRRLSLREAIRLAGDLVPKDTVWRRLKRGWDLVKAVETPADTRFDKLRRVRQCL